MNYWFDDEKNDNLKNDDIDTIETTKVEKEIDDKSDKNESTDDIGTKIEKKTTDTKEIIKETETNNLNREKSVVDDAKDTKNLDDKNSNKKETNSQHTFQPISDKFLPGNFDPFAKPINPRFAASQKKSEPEFEERVIEVKRVIKTTKGGRRFKFSALVIVGDKKGNVGYAVGKHIEVPEAIKKAARLAKKNMIFINVVDEQDTITHEIIGHHGAAKVMLKPASEGKGVIASNTVRAVVELAGIRNIYSKNLGSNNKHNVVNAVINGLTNTKTKEEIFALRKIIKKPITDVSMDEKHRNKENK